MTRGKLIVIEGADGTGKQTQAALLEERLRTEGFAVEKFAFPRYDLYFGRMIKEYLEGHFGNPTEINPQLASLLYSLDRMDAAPEIKRLIDSGTHVICDRFIESNMGFQAAKIYSEVARENFLIWLEDLEHNRMGVPRSDLVFYLHTSVEVSQALIKERSEGSSRHLDGHEEDIDYQQRVFDTYKWIASRREHSKWCLIDCLREDGTMGSREEIHETLYKKSFEVINK